MILTPAWSRISDANGSRRCLYGGGRVPRIGSVIVFGGEVAFQFGLESVGGIGYLLGLFVYSIAAAVVLPIPVELFLPLYPSIDPAVKAVVLGLGKAVGAFVVFLVGNKVNPFIERWMGHHPVGARVLKVLEEFVRRTGWIGLTVLLAIPFMSDTAVNYFYSVLNEEGRAIGRRSFVLANLMGGIGRAYLFLWLLSV